MLKMRALASNTIEDRAGHPICKYFLSPAIPASARDAVATTCFRWGLPHDGLRQCCELAARNAESCRHRELVPRDRSRILFPARYENSLVSPIISPSQIPAHDNGMTHPP